MKKILLFTSIFLIVLSIDVFAQHPTNLQANNITAFSVDLSWDGSMCTGGYYLRYMEVGSSWTTITTGVSMPYTLSGLSPATNYEWQVKCIGTTGWSSSAFFTTNNVPIIQNVTITDSIDCFGEDGELTIEVTQTNPATSPLEVIVGYAANWNPNFIVKQASSTITTLTTIVVPGLIANDYIIRLVDPVLYYASNPNGSGTSLDGVYDEYSIVISLIQPTQLAAITSVVASNMCAGDSIAKEDLTISGGTMPYSFDITSSSGTVTQNLANGDSIYSFVGLWADNYDIVVTDTNGCSTLPPITTFSIAPISPIIPAGTVYVNVNWNGYNVSCYGASDGEITAYAAGGTGILTYSLDGINFQSSATFSNLQAGPYTVSYKDANGCIETEQLILNEPPDLSGTASVTANILCYGVNSGVITYAVDPSNPGVPPYNYSLDNFTTSQSSSSFNNLYGDSTYNVMIQDDNGCQHVSPVYLAEPNQIIYSTTPSSYNGFGISCFGYNDGSIDFTNISGGLAPYEYSIDGGGSFSLLTNYVNLPSATYPIAVRDASGCIQSSTAIVLADPGVFSVPFVISNTVDCPGVCDGAVSINPSNGVGNILYDLDGGIPQSTPYFSGLCGDITNTNGSYLLTAIDDNLCGATGNISFSEPAAFVYSTSSNQDDYCSQSNGQASISVTSGGTGAYSYEWTPTNPIQNAATANNLAAGTYSVTVTDANFCQFSESVTVNADQGFTVSFSTVSPCLGPNSGSATVYATGTPAYTYQWSDGNGPITGATSATISNIPIGTYFVDVTDATTCTVTGSVDVMPPLNPIMFDTVVVTNNSCYGIDDAQIEIIVSGGLQPYSYSDDFGSTTQSNQVFGLLAPGTYDLQAYDGNGCFVDTTILLSYPGLLQIDSTYHTHVSCNGVDDAEILAINVLGGTAPFAYSVNGGPHYTNLATFDDYGPGQYTVEVFDANNCGAADIIIIDEPAVLDVNITTSGWVFNNNTNTYTYKIKCNGDTSGYMNYAINGGTTPYTMNYYDAVTSGLIEASTGYNITGLTEGQYMFEVIDGNGCEYTETINFNAPTALTHTFIPIHITCNGWSNGSLVDSISGGVGDATSYTYQWSDGNGPITGANTYEINNIPADTFIMTVTDLNNCLSTDTFIMNDDSALAATALVVDVSCFDYCDGLVTTTVTGGMPYLSTGSPIYLYQWDDILLQQNDTAIGLCADNNVDSTEYSCIITDSQGCKDTVFVTLYQPDSLYVTASVVPNPNYNLQDISCYGASDGELEASTIGGNPNYDYIWSTGFLQNNVLVSNISDLNAGMYSVAVKDSKGCMDTAEVTLTQPDELIISVSPTNINCFGIYDGSITAEADGGTPVNGIPPRYNYSFSNGFNEQINISTADSLLPGIYTVTATDNNGCSVTSGSIFISEPELLTIDLDSVDEGCNLNNGEVISHVAGGTQPYFYNWSNGISGTMSTIDLLSPGYYHVEVIDHNDCKVEDTIRVVGSMEVFLPGNIASFDTAICLGTTFEINIEEKPGFSYMWMNGNDTLLPEVMIDTANSTNDTADIFVYPEYSTNIYTLTISDPSCGSYDATVTIYVDSIDPMIASDPGVEIGSHPIVLLGDYIDLYSNPNGGISPYVYSWEWTNDDINFSIPIPDAGGTISDNPENSGLYHLMVEDAVGCVGYESIYVVVGVLPYEAITPNGDGINDEWVLDGMGLYEDALIQVFNRWGALVYESGGGAKYQPWDKSNGVFDAAVGTYYYIIDLNTGNEPQTGTITIIR